jgi:hypothetical protein
MAAAEAGDDTVVDKALAVLEDAARRGDAFAAAMLAERAVASLTAEGHVDEARTALDAALVAVRAAAAAGTARDAAEPAPAPGSDDVPIASESPAGDLLPLDPPEAMAARHRVVLDWLAGDDPARGLLTGPAPDGAARLHALAEVRAALAPYADRTCGVGYRSFAGAASFHLGRLAAAAGDWADAERHLQAALRHHTVLRARPWVALTQRALAEVLEARGRTSDREWIAGLRSEADHVTSTLGLRAD